MKCSDPAYREPEDVHQEPLFQGGITRHQTHRLVFWVTPAICIALTVVMATVPSPASVGQAIICYFTYTSLQFVHDEGVASGTSSDGGFYMTSSSQRNVITMVMFLYLPVLYLWQATGRLAKAHSVSSENDLKQCTGQSTTYVLGRYFLPWFGVGSRSHSGGHRLKVMNVLGVTWVMHLLVMYLQLLWAINLYICKSQAEYVRYFFKGKGTLVPAGQSCKRLTLHMPLLSKFWLSRASSKAQEARRGGEKDWKKLKKAWALKSWSDLQHKDVLRVYNTRVSILYLSPDLFRFSCGMIASQEKTLSNFSYLRDNVGES